MKPTHLLFDHDGVLVDTEPLYFQATQRALRELDVDIDFARYQPYMTSGRTIWKLALAAGWSEAEVDTAKTRRNRYYQEAISREPIDISGVPEVLRRLSTAYTMGIVTTAKKADFELIHRQRQIVPYMSLVLASGDYPRAKPHPDPYLTALDHFGISADEAVAIEDSERGLRAACAAGLRCIVVYNSFTADQDLGAAWRHVEDLTALEALLATL
jgi:HAD superfamily hydrolase (TIGR01509 family)